MKRALAPVIATLVAVAACSGTSRPGGTTSVSITASKQPPTTAAVPDVVTRSQQLQDVVDAFVASQPVPFSVVVIDETTGARATNLADRQVPSASLYKLFVARELLRRIDEGELSRDAAAGDAQGRTVEQCVHDMIVVSDNACGVAGLHLVGGPALDDDLRDDGYGATTLESPQETSAADVAYFLSRARSDRHLADLYALLRAQEVNDRLPLRLPPGTPIAHKTGDVRHYAHDAGVITTPSGDVIVAVLSGPWPLPCCDADHPGEAERVAFGAIADLGRAVYDAIA